MNKKINQNDIQKTHIEQRSYLETMSAYATSHPTLLHTFYKTEKLVTALYMVTDMVDLNDTLKCRIRDHAMETFDALYRALRATDTSHKEHIRTALFAAEYVRSLITIARNLGSLSEMNYRILHKEMYLIENTLDRLLDVDVSADIQERRKQDNNIGDYLETAYQDIPQFTDTRSQVPSSAQVRHQSISSSQASAQAHPHNTSASSSRTSRPQQKSSAQQAPKTTLTTSQKSKTTSPAKPKTPRGETDIRRNLILDIIKDKGEAMMKDFATRITNCTEKTLQRDLAYLIDKDIIQKEGKRRWSKYRLR